MPRGSTRWQVVCGFVAALPQRSTAARSGRRREASCPVTEIGFTFFCFLHGFLQSHLPIHPFIWIPFKILHWNLILGQMQWCCEFFTSLLKGCGFLSGGCAVPFYRQSKLKGKNVHHKNQILIENSHSGIQQHSTLSRSPLSAEDLLFPGRPRSLAVNPFDLSHRVSLVVCFFRSPSTTAAFLFFIFYCCFRPCRFYRNIKMVPKLLC